MAKTALLIPAVFLCSPFVNLSYLSRSLTTLCEATVELKYLWWTLWGRIASEYGLEFVADFRGRLLNAREDGFGG
jgi:hypothetical protein